MAALISHRTPQAVLAYVNGRAFSALDYLTAVRHMADRLPADSPVLNLCVQRHHFAVVLGAALLRGVPLLLPPTRTPEMLRRLAGGYPGLHVVLDEAGDSAGLPQLAYEGGAVPAPGAAYDVPDIDARQIAAFVFTSGSTGEPVPHAKRWGALVHDALATGARLREYLAAAQDAARPGAAPFVVTGTVPAQHMYGLEVTVMLPLLNGAAIDAAHPFYPADIATALAAVPRPRVLVTTPFHLRALLESGVTPPAVDLMLSATAPLTPQLSGQAERVLGAPLLEIYGSTETGQIATRRTAAGDSWQTYAGIELHQQPATDSGEPVCIARGGHVEGDVVLGDVLDLASPTRFTLRGRRGDMVNIAGKRTSLAYLNHQLNSIAGVRDGVIYWPGDVPGDEASQIRRPLAFVVAPDLTPEQLARELRERIDAAFMPRPIHFVDSLPRNTTGKLTAGELAALARACTEERHG